jgi:outer membrane protein assembly factor BamB
MIRARFRSFFAAASISLAACSSSAGSAPGVPVTPTQGPSQDDWLTFGHDYERTAFESQNAGLTSANVARLKLRWKRSLGAGAYASPIAFGGSVIVVTLGEGSTPAVVTDFRASDGTVLWTRALEAGVRATPSIDPGAGELFVSDRHRLPGPSTAYAIRLLDGSIAWRQSVPGITHSSPVVAEGKVFFGISGGDPGSCIDGGIVALDERTGAPLWRWEVNSAANGGGSVWGAIAYDGRHLIFGTGNTCANPVPTANGAVALNLDGTVAWSFTAQKDASTDDDTGSGVLISGGRALFMNKNGTLYSVSEGSGSLAWATPLGAADQNGGFATASTDGSTIVEGAGSFPTGARAAFDDRMPARGAPNEVIAGYTSRLDGLDTNGAVRWSVAMTNRLTGDAAIEGGMAFAGLDKTVAALDLRTGKRLWTYATDAYLDAPPIVVPSGVYAADDAGDVYAFSIP